MNSTKAICGHYTWAIGAPYSKAREQCEKSLCSKCEEIVQEHIIQIMHQKNIERKLYDWLNKQPGVLP